MVDYQPRPTTGGVRPGWFFAKRSFAQQGEDLVLERVLNSRLIEPIEAPGFFVDVGAYHPVLSSVTHLLHLRGWRGMAIDASGTTEKLFRRYRPKDIFVRAVVGYEDGVQVPFHFSSSGSFSQINTKYPSAGESYVSETMGQISLDAELERQGIKKIDVLNLDIEGAEFEALQGLNIGKYTPSVIVVEIHADDMRQVMDSAVSKFLLAEGYTLVASCVISHFFVSQVKPVSSG